jgi:hypothetical protein
VGIWRNPNLRLYRIRFVGMVRFAFQKKITFPHTNLPVPTVPTQMLAGKVSNPIEIDSWGVHHRTNIIPATRCWDSSTNEISQAANRVVGGVGLGGRVAGRDVGAELLS